MTDALAQSSPQQAVPQGYAEKAMASLMQLHTELMDEKERRVELYRRLMEREQSLAELKSYVKLLEERVAAAAPRPPPAVEPVAAAEVSPLRAEVEARSAAQASRIHAVPRSAMSQEQQAAPRSEAPARPSLVTAHVSAVSRAEPAPPAARSSQAPARSTYAIARSAGAGRPAMAAVGARPGRPDGWKTW